MITNSYQNTALIDSDYIIWIAANRNKVYEHGIPKMEDKKFVYTDKTVEEAKATCDLYMNDILNLVRADSYILCLTTGQTFRAKFDNSYKANRAGMERPMWFNEIKQHMKDEWGAIEKIGLEADDMVCIIKNELTNCFIVAADKDVVDCTEGKHFDARRGRVAWLETTKEQADMNFAISMLTGDAVDGIAHLEKGMGPKTAEELIRLRVEMNLISPISAAFNIFLQKLGEVEGVKRFYNQYRLLKMITSLKELPEGIDFEIPEPLCYHCVETILSQDFYDLYYEPENNDTTGGGTTSDSTLPGSKDPIL